MTSQEIRIATQRDPILSKVKSYVLKIWPEKVPQPLKVFHSNIEQLTVEDECLLWGEHVIIPQSVREVMKAEIFDQRKHSEGKCSSENIKKETDKKTNN